MPTFSTKRRVRHSASEMFDLVADVEQYPRLRRNQRKELRRIEDMATPDIADRARSDQIDPAVPGTEQFDIDFQPRQCFT